MKTTVWKGERQTVCVHVWKASGVGMRQWSLKEGRLNWGRMEERESVEFSWVLAMLVLRLEVMLYLEMRLCWNNEDCYHALKSR